MVKKKIIRLNESDIERLVKKILKENGDLDWMMGVEEAPEVYKVLINSWEEMVKIGEGTRWSVANPGIPKFYHMYTQNGQQFTVFINKTSNEKYICLGEEFCFNENDSKIKASDLKQMFHISDFNEIPTL